MQRLLVSLLFISISMNGMVPQQLDLEKIAQESSGNILLKKIGESSIVEYNLPKECTAKMNSLVASESIDPYKNWEHYRTYAKEVVTQVMPSEFLAIIHNMRHHNQPTALIVHDMPVDENIPATPLTGNRPPYKGELDGKGYVSETSLLGLCSLLGAHPDYDENEKDGTYINQIIPRDDAKSKTVASSFGSEVPFHPHTENVYSEPPLKFFSLLCLRGDPQVATSMIFLDHILEYIKQNPHHSPSVNASVLNEIKKAQFMMKSGPSFEGRKGHEVVLPILTNNEKGERVYRFNANPNRVAATNETSEFVISYLKTLLTSREFLDKCKTSVHLKKGDLLLFNNWEVMHARDSFKIDKENWRWLQRCYFMLDEYKK
jgi:alpha-ketoglutarate-dependent taurine dioxygenase